MEAMTGIPAAHMLGKGDYQYSIPFYGERRPILVDLVLTFDNSIASLYDTIRREDNKLFSEVLIPRLNGKNGVYLWFTASPLYNSEGKLIGAIESIRDITDRRVTERALRESEQLYRNVVEDRPNSSAGSCLTALMCLSMKPTAGTLIKKGKRSLAITSSPGSCWKTRKRYVPCLPLSPRQPGWFYPAEGRIS